MLDLFYYYNSRQLIFRFTRLNKQDTHHRKPYTITLYLNLFSITSLATKKTFKYQTYNPDVFFIADSQNICVYFKNITSLTYFILMFHFYTPLKDQKTFGSGV